MSSTPINSSVPPESPDYQPVVESSETAAPETLPVAKDTLSQTSPESQTIKIAPVTTKPKLPHPETESISMWDFLTAIGDSKLDFQHVLQRSAMADIIASNQSSKSLLGQVELVSSLESDLDNAIEEVEIQTTEAVAELQSVFDEAQDLVEAQNELTKMLEAGNAEEKEQFAALHDAFKTFKSGVEELKLTDTGNGKDVSIYTIPDDPEIQKQYNQLVEDLNEAITTFNTYITIRSAEVQAYNAAVNEYNAQAAELNQTINQISEQFGLSLAKDPIPLAETRDTSVYQTIPLAETANTTPLQVHVYLPPPNSEVIGKNGPAPMAQLSYTATDASIYENAIYNRIYAEIVTSLEEELNTQTHLLAMMSLQANQPHEEYSPDPFLNRKPLSQLLLPDANIIYRKKRGSEELELILENLRIKIEAEKNLAKEAIEGVITVSLKKFDEKRTDQLMDKLALLSVEQLSRRSLEALLNSIQQVGPSLALLPKDSPLFVIVFALNFVKNVLQETQTGQTDKEIDALMDKMFEVGTLGSDQKELIRAGMIIHQLMVAGKLLESNLGLSGLFTGFLASHLPHLQASPDQQTQALLSDKLKTIFLDQGYSDDKAEFLAKMGSEGVFEGTFLAAPLSTITSSNIHLPVLIGSLTASLILSSKSNLSLAQATALAESAASRTLSQAPFKSSDRFRKVLENELKDLGLKEKSEQISKQSILIPRLEGTAASDYPATLITPHIGKKQAVEIAKEIRQTFENLTKTIEIQSRALPSSLANELLSEALNNSFELYSFLSTLNNPASLFIYSLPNETIKHNNELQI